ncbi:uncharacterized protein LOC143277838 isoform X2 [Babylonia areolata]|uniref:uncharacterized protein LOC143277838 isoform X2 n=1 Tax=Babylonia areolata TaxID=304850 RepID=UPI003FD128E4
MGRPRGGGSGTSYGLRRRSGGAVINPMLYNTGVELMMECVDDVLSPSQIEAARKAKEEFKKAQKKIEEAKAEAARAAAAAQAAAKAEAERQAAAKAEAERQVAEAAAAAAAANFARQPSSSSRGSGSTSPDIMIVGESPPRIGQKMAPPRSDKTSVPKPMSGPIINPITTQGVLPPHAAGVPQEMYQFSQPGQNKNNNHQQNQWFLRPIQPAVTQQSYTPAGLKQQTGNMVTIVSGTSGLGIKRAFNMPEEVMPIPPNKKSRGRLVMDGSNGSGDVSGGNWVPLDEYYYGKMEGDPTFTEEKSEFRFRCWICTKMLYNNVKAMMHLQGHIDSEKQQNLDLSDLTQCKHCYKQFDTPFEMQTHIEKVHLSNMNVLMCRICEKDHESRYALTNHMRQNHCACEMPYTCQLCHFRSSMYSDVVDHFKKRHDSSDSLLCLYCLRVFHVKFVSQGWGQTQVYYHHLLRHQSKTANRKCSVCKLSFFNAQDLKTHRKTHHQPNQKGVIGANQKLMTGDQVMIKVPETGIVSSKGGGGGNGGPKSLNAPAVSKVQEHRGLYLPPDTAVLYCFECKMLMSTGDHYKKYIQCSMCRFATSCSFAYATHMMGFHSGQVSALSQSVPVERSLTHPLYCLCGFVTKFGNKLANHLVFCSKRTGYLNKPEIPPQVEKPGPDEIDPRHKPDASILDVLGLVKKQSVVNTSVEGDEGVTATTPDCMNIPDKEDQAHSALGIDEYKVKTPSLEQDGAAPAPEAMTIKEDTSTDAIPHHYTPHSPTLPSDAIAESDTTQDDSSTAQNVPPSQEEEAECLEEGSGRDGETALAADASQDLLGKEVCQPLPSNDSAIPETGDLAASETEDTNASEAESCPGPESGDVTGGDDSMAGAEAEFGEASTEDITSAEDLAEISEVSKAEDIAAPEEEQVEDITEVSQSKDMTYAVEEPVEGSVGSSECIAASEEEHGEENYEASKAEDTAASVEEPQALMHAKDDSFPEVESDSNAEQDIGGHRVEKEEAELPGVPSSTADVLTGQDDSQDMPCDITTQEEGMDVDEGFTNTADTETSGRAAPEEECSTDLPDNDLEGSGDGTMEQQSERHGEEEGLMDTQASEAEIQDMSAQEDGSVHSGTAQESLEEDRRSQDMTQEADCARDEDLTMEEEAALLGEDRDDEEDASCSQHVEPSMEMEAEFLNTGEGVDNATAMGDEEQEPALEEGMEATPCDEAAPDDDDNKDTTVSEPTLQDQETAPEEAVREQSEEEPTSERSEIQPCSEETESTAGEETMPPAEEENRSVLDMDDSQGNPETEEDDAKKEDSDNTSKEIKPDNSDNTNEEIQPDDDDNASKEMKPEDDVTKTDAQPEEPKAEETPEPELAPEEKSNKTSGDTSSQSVPEDTAETQPTRGTGKAGVTTMDSAKWPSGGGPSRGSGGVEPSVPSSQPGPGQPEESDSSGSVRKGDSTPKDKREEKRPAPSAPPDKGRGGSGSSQHPPRPYSSSDRDRQHSRDYDHRDRSYDRSRDYSDHRDYRRDYRDRDRDSYNRHYQYDRHRDQRYDNQHGQHGRYQQGSYQQGGYNSQDRYYNQNRQGNRGGQNRHGYNDRNYYRGYY